MRFILWSVGSWFQRFMYGLSVTNWLAYFAVNGPGEIRDKRFTGFHECPNSYNMVGQFTAQITGKYRGKGGFGLYYASVIVDGLEWSVSHNKDRLVQDTVTKGGAHLDSYARSECRCRLGFHWKCGIHHNWQG